MNATTVFSIYILLLNFDSITSGFIYLHLSFFKRGPGELVRTSRSRLSSRRAQYQRRTVAWSQRLLSVLALVPIIKVNY